MVKLWNSTNILYQSEPSNLLRVVPKNELFDPLEIVHSAVMMANTWVETDFFFNIKTAHRHFQESCISVCRIMSRVPVTKVQEIDKKRCYQANPKSRLCVKRQVDLIGKKNARLFL